MTSSAPKAEHHNEQCDLPTRLSAPAKRALAGAGIKTLEDLTRFSKRDILKLHGVGPKTIPPLEEALAARGLSFAGGS